MFTLSKVGTYSYHCSIHPFTHGTATVRREPERPHPQGRQTCLNTGGLSMPVGVNKLVSGDATMTVLGA